jgi:hypothetical protein
MRTIFAFALTFSFVKYMVRMIAPAVRFSQDNLLLQAAPARGIMSFGKE